MSADNFDSGGWMNPWGAGAGTSAWGGQATAAPAPAPAAAPAFNYGSLIGSSTGAAYTAPPAAPPATPAAAPQAQPDYAAMLARMDGTAPVYSTKPEPYQGGGAPAGTPGAPAGSPGAQPAGAYNPNTDYYNLGARGTYAADYRQPDWMRTAGLGFMQDREATNAFFAANPQYAEDWQRITSGGKSAFSTDGTSLIKTDFSTMSPEAAAHYARNPDQLMAAEGFGYDPTLQYMNYYKGPGSIGVDGKRTNVAEFMSKNRWTPNGIQAGGVGAQQAATPFGAGYASFRAAAGGGGTGGPNPNVVSGSPGGPRPTGNSYNGSPGGYATPGGAPTGGVYPMPNMGGGAPTGGVYPMPNTGGGDPTGGVMPPPAGGFGQTGGMESVPGFNPYLTALGGVMSNQMTQNFQRNIQPQIASGAMRSGGVGGSRQGVIEANASNDLNTQIGNALTNLYGGGFNTALNYDLGLRNNQLGLLNSAQNYDLGLRGNDLGYAGLEAQINQQNFNNRLSGANFGLGLYERLMMNNQLGIGAGTNIQNTPLNYWSQFGNQYNSIGQGYGTSTGSQSGNPLMGAIGGAQLGSRIGNWWGGGIGGSASNTQNWTYGGSGTNRGPTDNIDFIYG